jgi:hypothetical protein
MLARDSSGLLIIWFASVTADFALLRYTLDRAAQRTECPQDPPHGSNLGTQDQRGNPQLTVDLRPCCPKIRTKGGLLSWTLDDPWKPRIKNAGLGRWDRSLRHR